MFTPTFHSCAQAELSAPDPAVHTIELMNRLHALDAALTACQRSAIAVEELREVWEEHCAELAGVAGTDAEWVDALLHRLASRHGIVGFLQLQEQNHPTPLR